MKREACPAVVAIGLDVEAGGTMADDVLPILHGDEAELDVGLLVAREEEARTRAHVGGSETGHGLGIGGSEIVVEEVAVRTTHSIGCAPAFIGILLLAAEVDGVVAVRGHIVGQGTKNSSGIAEIGHPGVGLLLRVFAAPASYSMASSIFSSNSMVEPVLHCPGSSPSSQRAS